MAVGVAVLVIVGVEVEVEVAVAVLVAPAIRVLTEVGVEVAGVQLSRLSNCKGTILNTEGLPDESCTILKVTWVVPFRRGTIVQP